MSYKKQVLQSLCLHLSLPYVFDGIRVTHLLVSVLSSFVLLVPCYVSCVQCCQYLWIVHFRLSLRFSLTFIHAS